MADDRSQESLLLRDSMQPAEKASPISSPRKGLWHFLVANPGVTSAGVFGLVCIAPIFAFTFWLSKEQFYCPPWAIGCTVKGSVSWIGENLGLVQGIVSALYAIALAAMAYTASALGEAAVWPILHKQAKTLKELDAYLQAVRGSFASFPAAYMATRSLDAFVVMLCISIAMITPLTGSTAVGYAYTKQNVTRDYVSRYETAAWVRSAFKQENPPARLPAAVSNAFNLYTSWANGLATEPMPEQRDFIINRAKLDALGDFSVNAVKVERTINCSGHRVNVTKRDEVSLETATSLGDNSTVTLRSQAKLTTWVDSIDYKNETRSISTLIFAALNGDIEGGEDTPVPADASSSANITHISAIACAVDVNLADSHLRTGSDLPATDSKKPANLSLVADLQGSNNADSPYGGVGDLAVWFAAVPTVMGISVHGTQPMFVHSTAGGGGPGARLPKAYTSYSDAQDVRWNQSQILRFVDVSSGALATSLQQLGGGGRGENATKVASRKATKQLDSRRAYVLLAPPVVILLMTAVLAAWDVWIHGRAGMPAMRLADVSEVIASAQTRDVAEAAAGGGGGGAAAAATTTAVDAGDGGQAPAKRLEKLRVKYGVAEGGVVGLAKTVSAFRSGAGPSV